MKRPASKRGRAKAGGGKAASATQPLPRLALIQLEGTEKVSDGFRNWGSTRKASMFLTGGVLLIGASALGAAWIGGSLLNARENVAIYGDRMAAQAGFKIEHVAVEGVDAARAAQARAAALPHGRQSLFAAQPEAVRERVKRLDWVQSVRVTRLWPATLKVEVQRRKAAALWRSGGKVRVVQADGRVLADAAPADYPDLPLVVGAGAGASAEPILAALDGKPAVRSRLSALVRVDDRRWDMKMKSGAIVSLPEKNPDAALEALAKLQTQYALLDRPVRSIDLRAADRLSVTPLTPPAPTPGPSQGA